MIKYNIKINGYKNLNTDEVNGYWINDWMDHFAMLQEGQFSGRRNEMRIIKSEHSYS
jgi:hypothetical protein